MRALLIYCLFILLLLLLFKLGWLTGLEPATTGITIPPQISRKPARL